MTLGRFALAILIGGFAQGGPAAASDACEQQLPASLRTAIAEAYPRYRPVRASDYSQEDVQRELQYHDGSPCLGVASADVDGDGLLDFVFLITSRKGPLLVMVARAKHGGDWQLEKLDDFGDNAVGRSYVNIIEAGDYTDIFTDAGQALEAGQVLKYRSEKPGFVAGTMEASGIAFFFTGQRWVHLWVQD